MREDRPLVGVLANTEVLDGVGHHAVREAYLRAVTEVAGAAAVLLPASAAAAGTLDRLDGVLLTGHQSDVGTTDPGRDAAAFAVIPAAVGLGLPLLGVCRGLQELNVAYGGTLRSVAGHREDERLPRDDQYLPRHPVSVAPGGVLHRIVGATEVWVNSLHGQVVDVLAPGMAVEAVAADGVVEAVSVVEARVLTLGVQWHPEWHVVTDPVCRAIFASFGAACRGRAARYRRAA